MPISRSINRSILLFFWEREEEKAVSRTNNSSVSSYLEFFFGTLGNFINRFRTLPAPTFVGDKLLGVSVGYV